AEVANVFFIWAPLAISSHQTHAGRRLFVMLRRDSTDWKLAACFRTATRIGCNAALTQSAQRLLIGTSDTVGPAPLRLLRSRHTDDTAKIRGTQKGCGLHTWGRSPEHLGLLGPPFFRIPHGSTRSDRT